MDPVFFVSYWCDMVEQPRQLGRYDSGQRIMMQMILASLVGILALLDIIIGIL